jgi:hypothetical protein
VRKRKIHRGERGGRGEEKIAAKRRKRRKREEEKIATKRHKGHKRGGRDGIAARRRKREEEKIATKGHERHEKGGRRRGRPCPSVCVRVVPWLSCLRFRILLCAL